MSSNYMYLVGEVHMLLAICLAILLNIKSKTLVVKVVYVLDAFKGWEKQKSLYGLTVLIDMRVTL